jgi:hypothetical protein
LLNPFAQLKSMDPHSIVGDVNVIPTFKTHPLHAKSN